MEIIVLTMDSTATLKFLSSSPETCVAFCCCKAGSGSHWLSLGLGTHRDRVDSLREFCLRNHHIAELERRLDTLPSTDVGAV